MVKFWWVVTEFNIQNLLCWKISGKLGMQNKQRTKPLSLSLINSSRLMKLYLYTVNSQVRSNYLFDSPSGMSLRPLQINPFKTIFDLASCPYSPTSGNHDLCNCLCPKPRGHLWFHSEPDNFCLPQPDILSILRVLCKRMLTCKDCINSFFILWLPVGFNQKEAPSGYQK